MDSPGMGGTSADTVNSNDDVLDLVIGFARDVIGDDKFLVVGHSYGGYLARAVARRCRQVAGLALVSTAGDERGEVPERVVLHARASWKVGLTSRTKVSSAATSSCRRGDAAAVP
jgi:pimeloyl-ACP methyl ester carboxylesterase